jgi:hypothetical protein
MPRFVAEGEKGLRKDGQPWGAHYAPDPTEEDLEAGRQLVREGWVQTSRKYRHIARLPCELEAEAVAAYLYERYVEGHPPIVGAADGVDPLWQRVEYLARLDWEPIGRAYIGALIYRWAKPEERTLDIDLFEAFRRAGGDGWISIPPRQVPVERTLPKPGRIVRVTLEDGSTKVARRRSERKGGGWSFHGGHAESPIVTWESSFASASEQQQKGWT